MTPLPKSTIPPRVTKAQITSLWAIAVVCVPDDVDHNVQLFAGPAGSVIVVGDDGKRWKIEADGKRITESYGEVPRRGD